MTYEDLHRRFGTHVAQRIQREISSSDFDHINIGDLADWLEKRAEAAHDVYRDLLNNPLASSDKDINKTGEACRRWRDAEDLAYLVAIAEDVGANARAV